VFGVSSQEKCELSLRTFQQLAKQPGRVTKWSAEGMLARFYLTRAGRRIYQWRKKQEFLDSAKYFASDVINNSGLKVIG
jgi:hypothetical protein